MCVDSKGYPWERPVTLSDFPILTEYFPGIDFQGLHQAMSRDSARPLVSDFTLVGAMLHSHADELGMCFVPFCGLENATRNIVKLPVMDQIVDWHENTALGGDMWGYASDWAETNHGGRFHFAMNCGCGFVATPARTDGRWAAWKARFNLSRGDVYGRTKVVRRVTDSIEGLDITEGQLAMWQRMRNCLESIANNQAVVNCMAA